MRKIPTIFKRNPENMREIFDDPHPDCRWVFEGEGIATRKYDGTCVKIEDGRYFKRREIKNGKKEPDNFIEEQFDENTGNRVGWIPVDPISKEDRWHMKAFDPSLPDGIYELIGPKIQGNPEKVKSHILFRISDARQYTDVPRNFDGIAEWLKEKDIEGIVFHHPDGRMGKVKKRDFGQKRI